MKVLHVIPSLSAVHGGPTAALALMERELTAQGIDVHTTTTDDDGPGRHNGNPCGVALAENGATRRYFRKQLDFYKYSPALAAWLNAHAGDYDLLHIHALFSHSTIAAARAAGRAKVPYVIRPLGTLSQYGITQRRPWLKRASLALLEGPALRQAAAVHFTSDAEKLEAAQWGLALRGVVIPLGIEAAAPAPAGLVRQRFGSLGDAPYLLYLSRLDPKKNIEGLLQAFSQVAARWPDLRLLIAGDGDAGYVLGLKAQSAAMGVADRVVWAGHVTGDIKASVLAEALAFVLPSHSENFGIAAAEALMAGLPCVLGQGVAIAQDVVSAGAGLAVAPDAGSIAAALRRLLADKSARAAMGANALNLARHKYSARAMGEGLLGLYEGLVLPISHRNGVI